VLDSLPLDVRQWICPERGVRHDRDVTAAKNMLAVGLTVNACGEVERWRGDKTTKGQARLGTPR